MGMKSIKGSVVYPFILYGFWNIIACRIVL